MAKLADDAIKAVEQLAQTNAAAKEFVRQFEPIVLEYCVGPGREHYHVSRWCGHVS